METKYYLNQTTNYQIFVRNHSKEGTFKEVTKDLPRIKELGVDMIQLLPIHPIGKKDRKGTYGSPYSVKDYYKISDDLGTLEDFKELVKETHKLGMKIILDMVFNHTAKDSVVFDEHPEFYYYHDNKPANKLGDWSDVIDLRMDLIPVQDYFINVLAYWLNLGVDGFRFDVASLIPMSFFKRAREKLGEKPIFFAESIHKEFTDYILTTNFYVTLDKDLYPTFDSSYNYNTYTALFDFLNGKTNSIKKYVSQLLEQEKTFPKTYNKSTTLENHDQKRIAEVCKNELALKNIVAFSFINKGMAFVYEGEEYKLTHQPELFEKDVIEFKLTDESYYQYIKDLIALKKHPAFLHYDNFLYHDGDDSTIEISFDDVDKKPLHGLFNLSGGNHKYHFENGTYYDLISKTNIVVTNNLIELKEPLLLKKI